MGGILKGEFLRSLFLPLRAMPSVHPNSEGPPATLFFFFASLQKVGRVVLRFKETGVDAWFSKPLSGHLLPLPLVIEPLWCMKSTHVTLLRMFWD